MAVRHFMLLMFPIVSARTANIKNKGFFFGQEIKVGYKHGDIHILTTFHDVRFITCVRKCRIRQRCDFMNYVTRFKMCYLVEHFNKNYEASDLFFFNKGSVLGIKSDWRMVQTDEVLQNFNRDCGPLDLEHGLVNGNMFSPEARSTYQCSNDLDDFVTFECKYGLWHTVPYGLIPEICYRDCEVWVHDQSCYIYVTEDIRTFFDADGQCREFGGYLVHIETQEEQELLQHMLVHLNRTDWLVALIGLTDMMTEGEFRWLGVDTPATFTYWYDGEPSGYDTENCVVMTTFWGFFWADITCDYPWPYICEFALHL